jgi:hypothetical protein
VNIKVTLSFYVMKHHAQQLMDVEVHAFVNSAVDGSE